MAIFLDSNNKFLISWYNLTNYKLDYFKGFYDETKHQRHSQARVNEFGKTNCC